ncbi:hypothetical protein SCUCBS95973_007796 [Sporothrix curviconia]|uniref:Peptidase A1 domain-containing protein n=1 Tax=Sporothrix curviconia TaxID=1260050 RepID=A0ABP0CH12_9PEZI
MSRYLLPLALTAASASVLPHTPDAGAAVAGVAARAPAQAGMLSFPIVERREFKGPATRQRLRRRDDEATLYNATNVAYMIELGLGTPPQQVRVQLDTGSNELWVDPDCSTVTDATSQAFCESVGTFVPSDSSTLVDTEESTTLAYGRGDADIEYVLDTVVVPGSSGNATLKQVQFGVAVASDDAAVPICGVGFGNNYNLEYDNIVDQLALQGVTKSRTLSLALGSATNDDGRDPVGDNIGNGIVIFGGVDTKKFAGPLYKFTNLPPQSDDPGQPWRYWIQMDSVGFTAAGKTSSSAYSSSSMPIVLDSGSSLSYLPQDVMDDLAKSFGVKAQSDGSLIVDCDAGAKGGYVDFTFDSLVISVPLSDFIWEAQAGVCAVGALPSTDTTNLLGDTFLRSAYVLFDQDHQNIYMAQAANCGSNEQVLSASGNYNLTGECTVQQKSAAAGLVPASAMALVALVGVQALMSFL